MIRIIIACALVSLAAAAVIPDDAQAQIISYHNENDGSGNYDFSFETSNGLRRKEVGRVINPGAENQYTDVEGSFSYTDADGKLVEVFYSADENGYHVKEKPSGGQGGTAPIRVVESVLGLKWNKDKNMFEEPLNRILSQKS